ncbi:hypothetical protein GCM10020367_23760 [Streptomyces sannanensis]|uniref:Lipoprotein n=1 Tax=Streptomyces sannanensis TaxID=285536 RepID=A0ABP6SA28_9ACTN
MRRYRLPGVLCVCVLLLASLAACQRGEPRAAGTAASENPLTPTGYGLTFLGVNECSARGSEHREVPCTSEKAAARVLARYDGTPPDTSPCPPTTDFVLHISERRPSLDENGDGAVPRGYACMRNLEPPHPGDPGMGGGPHTIVGDCVYSSRKGEVKETACDGSGPKAPQFKVASAVATRSQCPPSTALYVQLGGEKPVGCARRV